MKSDKPGLQFDLQSPHSSAVSLKQATCHLRASVLFRFVFPSINGNNNTSLNYKEDTSVNPKLRARDSPPFPSSFSKEEYMPSRATPFGCSNT